MSTNKLRPLYHDECQALLPSFINGRLDAAQQRQVQEHVAQCDICFEELQQAQQVVEAIRSEPVELEPLLGTQRMEANLEQVLRNIEGEASPEPKAEEKVVFLANWRRSWGQTPKAAKRVVWGQAACLMLAAGMLVALPSQQQSVTQPQGVTLQTYSSDDVLLAAVTEQSQVYRMIFHPAATEADIRTLLNNVDAQIISGPSKAGLYTISTLKPSTQQELVLNNLRTSPWVKLAEPSVLTSKNVSEQEVQE